MRFFRVFVLLSCRFLVIATAQEQQAAKGGSALRGPSFSDHHRRQHRVAQEVDGRCQIPTIGQPDCVDNQDDFLAHISDNTTELILVCQGATIVLERENFVSIIIIEETGEELLIDSSILINFNKTIICKGGSKGDCIIDGLDISGNQEPAFKIELVAHIQVNVCGISFKNFGVVSAASQEYENAAASLVNHLDENCM
jgi:hypothetical protein